jgi:hypothetical protein
VFSPVNFHHNGEAWVSQDENWEAKAELYLMITLILVAESYAALRFLCPDSLSA